MQKNLPGKNAVRAHAPGHAVRWPASAGRPILGLLAAMLVGAAGPAKPPALVRIDDLAAKFGARPFVQSVELSPSGSSLLVIAPYGGTRSLAMVLDVATAKLKPLLDDRKAQVSLKHCFWKTDERLICTLSGSDHYFGQLLGYGRTIAVDKDSSHITVLGRLPTGNEFGPVQFTGYVIDPLPDDPAHVLMAISESARGGGGTAAELVDIHTNARRAVESAHEDVAGLATDGHGHVRIRAIAKTDSSGNGTGRSAWFLRTADNGKWQPIGQSEALRDTGFQVLGFDEAGQNILVLKPKDGLNALYSISADGSGKETLVYANDTVDVAGLRRMGKYSRPVSAVFVKDRVENRFLDPATEKLTAVLSNALKGQHVSIADESWDGTKKLVFAGSDTDPGRVYLFQRTTHRLEPLLDIRPELAERALGAKTPVRYKASDGAEVPAYLTLPPGVTSAKGLPAIVMPHGGPEARDTQGFDWLSQYFAAMGYAVLQPNFRGSTGYGEKWFAGNAFKSWKIAMSDVNDGGRWLLSQGVDPRKLAIFGWSYGGYAALQANVVDPDLYKAVVAVAPVSDLGLLKSESSGFTDTRIERDRIGSGPLVAEGSPARHADRFKAPVLIFQGDRDLNVNAEQARRMDSALAHAHKLHTLVMYPGLDHQLDDGDARADMLRRSAAFLAEHLGVNPVVASSTPQ